MSTIKYFSEEGLQKLREELHELETKGRAQMARQIAEARDKGDLSENAEYDAAKEAQGMLEMKIANLQNDLANARVMDESKVDTSKVLILSTVKVLNKKVNKEFRYTIVTENEADLKAGKISVKSPIAEGLLGRKVGEEVKITVPAGQIPLEILEITR